MSNGPIIISNIDIFYCDYEQQIGPTVTSNISWSHSDYKHIIVPIMITNIWWPIKITNIRRVPWLLIWVVHAIVTLGGFQCDDQYEVVPTVITNVKLYNHNYQFTIFKMRNEAIKDISLTIYTLNSSISYRKNMHITSSGINVRSVTC